jgi:hypothetical protein
VPIHNPGVMISHKMPGEKQEHYDMFMVWLGLPYEDPPKERTIREVYRRKTDATSNPSSHYFRVRDATTVASIGYQAYRPNE